MIFKTKTIVVFICVFILYAALPNITFAWNNLPYSPGATLNPDCLPTDVNCDVTTFSPSFLSAISPLSYSSTTGMFSMSQASSTSSGYLSSVDWNIFNNKQNAITTGTSGQYLKGDLSLGTFPTTLSSFTNDVNYLTSSVASSTYLTISNALSTYYPLNSNPAGYLTSFTETDPVFTASAASGITSNDLTRLSTYSGTSTGTNTGDETQASIKSKLGSASSGIDGYLTGSDWNTFNSKQNAIATGTASQYLKGDLSLGTFPTVLSSFTNDTNYIGSTSANNLADARIAAATSTIQNFFSASSSLSYSAGAFSVASDYNIPLTASTSNWNTAYSWGNHATAGYLLSSVASSTYAPLSGATFTGSISAPNISGSVSGTFTGTSSGTNTGDETQATIKSKLGLASSGVDGYLLGSDWNIFNGKQNTIATGTLSQYFRGDFSLASFPTVLTSFTNDANFIASSGAPVQSIFGRQGAVTAQSGDYNTSQVNENGNLYFTNARAIGSTLTGYLSGAGNISSSDSVLSAIQKLNGNIGGLVTGVSSVSNSDGTLSISPTGGAVVASLNLGNANTWTGQQIFNGNNVGIGTSSPSAKLSIHDNSGLVGTNPLFVIASSTSGNLATTTLFSVLGNGNAWLTGNLGFGSTTPGSTLSGPLTSAFSISASAQTQSASTLVGNDLVLNASNATPGSTNASAANGGSVSITAGNASMLTSGLAVGGSISLTGGNGIASGSGTANGGAINLIGGLGAAGGNSAAPGGLISIISGASRGSGSSGNVTIKTADSFNSSDGVGLLTIKAGDSTGSGSSVNSGGILNLTTGNGSIHSSAVSVGGAGGASTYTIGTGGAASGNTSGIGGTGGAFLLSGGSGGNATGSGASGVFTGGVGSTLTFNSGAGGSATGSSGTRTGGNSGNIVFNIGAVGLGSTTNGTLGNFQFLNGNILAGTTTSLGGFTLSNSTWPQLYVNGPTTSAGLQFAVAGTQAVTMGYDTTNGLQIGTLGTASVKTLALRTNGITRLNIDNNGNFGIGTTTTAARFAIHETSGSVGTTPLFVIASSTSAGLSTTTLFQVLGNGNVGIGTTPSYALSVDAVNGARRLNIGSANNAGNLFFDYTSTGFLYGLKTDNANTNLDIRMSGGYISLSTLNKEVFRVTGQSVGIGTTSPSAKLAIQDNSGLAGTNSLFVIASSTSGYLATTTLFTVLGNGNVGLGNVAPSALLSVGQTSGTTWESRLDGRSYSTYYNSVKQSQLTDNSLSFKSSNGTAMANTINSPLVGTLTLTTTGSNIILGFGGSTSAYPALKNIGKGIAFRLADDTGDATTSMAALTVSSSTLSSYFAGNIGIGTTTPSAQLDTTGTVRFENFGAGTLQTDSAGNVTAGASDERLKNIQGNFTRGIADLQNINPILYKWKPETGFDTVNTYAGFSAQNVQLSIPEAVSADSQGYLSIQDRPIIAALVNAVKEIGSVFVQVANGVAYLTNIAVQHLTVGSSDKPTGITIYDSGTGQPYCMRVYYGQTQALAGTCESLPSSLTASVTSSVNTSVTQNTSVVSTTGSTLPTTIVATTTLATTTATTTISTSSTTDVSITSTSTVSTSSLPVTVDSASSTPVVTPAVEPVLTPEPVITIPAPVVTDTTSDSSSTTP